LTADWPHANLPIGKNGGLFFLARPVPVNEAMRSDTALYSGLVRLHIFHVQAKAPFLGLWSLSP
jgi:hypothetical protein